MESISLFKKAELLYENDNFECALQLFRQIENNCTNFDIQNYIGCCLLNLEQYWEAKKIFEAISIQNPDWSRPMFNLGRAYMMLNEYEKAYHCFNKAIFINPEDADAYYYRGVYFEKVNDYNNAIADYSLSVSLNPTEFEPHVGLCLCYDCIGSNEKALNEARTAFEIFNCNDTLYNYTLILNKHGKYELSFELLQNNNALLCNDIGLIKNMMFCAKKLNQNLICLECAKKILEQYPNDCFAKKVMTDIYIE